MSDVRGPKDGYLFEAKADYRWEIWSHFACYFGKFRGDARVAFMPSSEGAEIEVALSLGFKEQNLIAIDDNPAVIAVAPWRREYPHVRFYGSELGRAFERIAQDRIRIDAANLDLCSNFSETQLESLIGAAKSGAMRRRCLIALTVLNGREQEHFSALLRQMMPRYDGVFPPRLAFPFLTMCKQMAVTVPGNTGAIRERHSAKYRSQTQTMLWGIAEFYERDDARRKAAMAPAYRKAADHRKVERAQHP